jgi:type II secretory pathway pseudopilin PulG
MSGIDRRRIDRRQGMTLIEVLIAMTMTLIVLGAMMAAFRYASGEISKGRAMIELSNQLRIAQEIMRTDLEGVTVDMRPWAITAGPNGYFEYIEGNRTDRTNGNGVDSIGGDVDDIIAMTVRGKEFHGRSLGGADITANAAEVVWWTNYEDRDSDGSPDYDESIKVYRRQLLIVPTLDLSGVPAATVANIQQFFQQYDISARWINADPSNDGVSPDPRDRLVANSLEDLAKRENRFCHWALVYPYLLDRAALQACQLANLGGLDARFSGNDIMISDVIGFDVQVYSPNTIVQSSGGLPVVPSDFSYDPDPTLPNPNVDIDQGTFVDLGWAGTGFDPTLPEFSTTPTLKSQLGYLDAFGNPVRILDTFSKHYESNGVDDDGLLGVDQATNGLDDDGINGVDDNGERETLPPYPFRIAGIKVSFRIVERTTKQVRQTSVVHSFLPK